MQQNNFNSENTNLDSKIANFQIKFMCELLEELINISDLKEDSELRKIIGTGVSNIENWVQYGLEIHD
jgi:hypothetical protein